MTDVFGRNKTTETTDPAPEAISVDLDKDAARSGVTPKKGRPTPKRREQEAARRQPLVPVDRKAAKKQSREEARKARLEQREAFARGDEKALPPRDKGPIKAFIRDYIDSRWNFGEILLPLMLVVLVLTVLPNRSLQMAAFFFLWLVVLVGIVDSVLVLRRIKKQIRERFHTDPPRGTTSYTIMRAFQLRMGRRPMPRVKRGDKV
ncbi:DUF3043 domain-containing protein [Flexivirga meconopsidis]|uniref:DUF3043 domain-containing protein n=1 Tax=Flexivirga meconopsidis TaxID=2977121 RepID=UPI0022409F10|nr:DUF3043 domain-containing protein [Flexivirga meconopsidis]